MYTDLLHPSGYGHKIMADMIIYAFYVAMNELDDFGE
jgi:hypothetical protein